MAETQLTDSQANALSGTTDSDTDVAFCTIGESTYYTTDYKKEAAILRIVKLANELRVYKDGDLTFAVRAGKFAQGDSAMSYAGAAAQTLTNNQTNYIYLTVVSGAAALNVNTTGFPTPSATNHIPLATILTASGAYSHSDITDYRGRALYRLLGQVDSHTHPRSALTEESLQRYQVPLMQCRNADGTVLDAAGAAGNLKITPGGWGSGTLKLQGEDATNNTKTNTLCFQFALPPEYIDSQDVQLVVRAKYDDSGGGVATTATIDAEVYELGDDGTAVSIRSSSTKNLTDSFADYAFDDIAQAALAGGDRLMVLVRTVITESNTSGSGSVKAVVGCIEIQLDIKG